MSKVSSTTRDKRSILADKVAASQSTEDRAIEGLVPLGAFNGYIRCMCLIDSSLVVAPPAVAQEKPQNGENQNGEKKEEKKEGEENAAEGSADQENKADGETEEAEEGIETITSGAVTGLTAWCGEQDGTISVRRADTGGLLTKTAERIQQCGKNSFVICLTQVGTTMWVGYSDGCLRVFDIATKKLQFEKKRHAGALNAIASGSYLVPKTFKEQTLVFTASDDFKIMVWSYDPEAGTKKKPDGEVVSPFKATGHALLGHSNAVKCLLVDGNHLYSGSDDGFVRIWSVEEVPCAVNNAPFPMHCHREGVRFIALEGDYLIAAGAKGNAVARYMDTGEVRHTFHPAGGANSSGGGVASATNSTGGGIKAMHLVQSTGTFFLAHQDGKVDVWDVADFNFLGTVAAHQAQVVANIAEIARSVETHILALGSNGSLVQLTTESDSFLSETDAPVTVEEKQSYQAQIFSSIEELRNKLMEDRDSMTDKRQQMDRLKKLADHEKRAAAAALMHESSTLMKRSYLNKVLVWMQRHRNAAKRQIVADCMMASTERGLRFLYYSRLGKFAQASIQRKQKQKLSDSILLATQKQLQLKYLKNATEYVRRKAQANTSLQVCEAMMCASDNGMRAVFIRKWQRFRLRQREMAKRKIVAYSLMKHSEKGSMVLYWNKFVQGVNAIKHLRMKEMAVHAMATTTERGHQMHVFRRLQRFAKKQAAERRRQIVIDVMARGSDEGMSRLYTSKWMNWVRWTKEQFSTGRLESLKAENDEMNVDINNPDIPQESDVDEMLAATQKELDEQKAQSDALAAEVATLTKEEKQLKKRLTQSVNVDSTKTLVEQMNQTSALLKPSVLHIQRHMGVAVELFQKLQDANKAAAAAAEKAKKDAAASPKKSTAASPAKASGSKTPAGSPKKGDPKSPTKKADPKSPTRKESAFPASAEETPKKEAAPAPGPKSDSPEGMFHQAVAEYRAAVKKMVDATSSGEDKKKEEGDEGEEKKEEGDEGKEKKEAAASEGGSEFVAEFLEGEFWTLQAESSIHVAGLDDISETMTAIRQCLLVWDHVVCLPDVSAKIAPDDTTFTGKDVNEFIQNASWAMEVMKRETQLRSESGDVEKFPSVEEVPRVAGIATGTAGATESSSAAKKPAAAKTAGGSSSTAAKPAAKKTTTTTSTVGGAKKTESSTAAKPAAKKATTTTSSSSSAAKPGAKKSTTTSSTTKTTKKGDDKKKPAEEKKEPAKGEEKKEEDPAPAEEKKADEEPKKEDALAEEKKDDDKKEEDAKKE